MIKRIKIYFTKVTYYCKKNCNLNKASGALNFVLLIIGKLVFHVCHLFEFKIFMNGSFFYT